VQTGTKVIRPDFAGDNRDQHAFLAWCALWMSECLRVAKPGSPICVFSDWRQLPSVTDAIQMAGWIWRGVLVWDKTEAARPCMGRFSSQCEYVVWGSAGPMPERADIGVLHGVIREPVTRSDKHHIAGKPTPVMKDIARICPSDGVIVDPFAGSGTTGVGALLVGRRFIGIELIEEYARVARERLAATENGVSLEEYRAGQMALFRGGE
jgi:site-specific DNA-methyltransferase (adenine-specific)